MIEKIDIRHMRVLLHLVREKNVSRVAERLEISQQAVSNYLKRMREVFPNELFLRQSAGLQPTDYAYDLAAKFEKNSRRDRKRPAAPPLLSLRG